MFDERDRARRGRAKAARGERPHVFAQTRHRERRKFVQAARVARDDSRDPAAAPAQGLDLGDERRDRPCVCPVRDRPQRGDDLATQRLRDFELGRALTRTWALLREARVQRLHFRLNRADACHARSRQRVVRLDVRVRGRHVRRGRALRAQRCEYRRECGHAHLLHRSATLPRR